MKGIELAEGYYREFGAPMLEAGFPELARRAAVGLAGSGSDCLGYDDELSADHDIKAGFMVWLTDDDYERSGFALAREFDRLPREYMGISSEHRSRMGDGRYGVFRIRDFFLPRTGSAGAPESAEQWFAIPSCYLAEAVSGRIFRDDLGAFSAERERVRTGMPRDVRLKKIAAKAALAAQAGQYNFARCTKHSEPLAAELALARFAESYMELTFLLEGRHMPFYKWAPRAMRELPVFGESASALNRLLLSGSTAERARIIEDLAALAIAELKRQQLSDSRSDYLEHHAYEVTERIEDPRIRGMHLMDG